MIWIIQEVRWYIQCKLLLSWLATTSTVLGWRFLRFHQKANLRGIDAASKVDRLRSEYIIQSTFDQAWKRASEKSRIGCANKDARSN